MRNDATVGLYSDEERAKRAVRWLRRDGMAARVDAHDGGFEVIVAGPDESRAHAALDAVERTRERPALSQPSAWRSVRSKLLSLEGVGTAVFMVVGAVLVGIVAAWLWVLFGMLGWLGLAVVLAAGFAYFHFSGLPHSAVKSPRPYSHKHDVTMEQEQQVQYRLAWARDEFRKSRRWRLRRRSPKD